MLQKCAFLHLHRMTQDSATNKMTTSIHVNIEHELHGKAFKECSTTKGAMTENRMSCDVNITEEYACGGHIVHTMNCNAEGYTKILQLMHQEVWQ